MHTPVFRSAFIEHIKLPRKNSRAGRKRSYNNTIAPSRRAASPQNTAD